MISRLLVANRAEIASRVFRTCRALGIETVALHSDADAALPYVREADRAVRLPGNTPSETYLRIDLVIDAARRSGADAVHPGYGFLSENAAFARAVIEAGLTWVGPDPESIEQMGSKVHAKELMVSAGVPVLANFTVDGATDSDLPLLVKASAGGGGRGMRIVRSLADLPREIAAAEAEAASAFGDGTVFVESYVERGRHVEVQVWGDAQRNISILGERDCSIQRRHQKVVEEAPAPGRLSDSTRQAMYDAARAAAEAIGYRGAGTVEFLFDEGQDRFFFLEMNTRLQVEHPVTELVTGLDLVELQLIAAEGGPGSARAIHIDRPHGHAIEVRLYAEDPTQDYRPQSGVLTTFEIPLEDGVRVDTGFASGSEVSTHYDAMLAKVVAWAPRRREAARKLAGVLSRARIHGLVTNRDLLVDILTSSTFLDEDVSTAFLDDWAAPVAVADRTAVVAGALMLAAADGARRSVQQGVPAAWRNVTSQPQRTEFEGHEPVEWWGTRDGFVVDNVTVLEVSPTHARLEVDGVAAQTRGHWSATAPGSPRELWIDGPALSACLREVPRFTDPADAIPSGSLLAPMPGTVVKVAVAEGDEVEAGDLMLVLEAMKMQHTITAPSAGRVTTLTARPGLQVAAGEVLAVVEGDDS